MGSSSLPQGLGRTGLGLEPGLEFLGADYEDLAQHAGVAEAAVLSADRLKGAQTGGGEPDAGDHTRDRVHLDPELGHVEVVDDVVSPEHKLDGHP